MVALQHWQQPLVVQSLRVVEVKAHAFRERFVAFGDGVVQVAYRDQLPEFEVCAAVHQQLKHQFQRGALALQRRRDGDQRLHQRRAERIDLAEHLPVGRGGEQGVEHVLAHLHHVVERGLQRLARGFVHRAQHALLGDGRQVAVFQRDAVKARFPVLQHIAELQLHRAGEVLAHEVAQVALARDEADQWHGPFGVGGLHQLHQLGALAADEVDVGSVAREPEHQFVQEQDDRVIAQCLGVAAHDAEPVVERDERLAAAGQAAVRREVLRDQVANEA